MEGFLLVAEEERRSSEEAVELGCLAAEVVLRDLGEEAEEESEVVQSVLGVVAAVGPRCVHLSLYRPSWQRYISP